MHPIAGAHYTASPSMRIYSGVDQYPIRRLPELLYGGIEECVGVGVGGPVEISKANENNQ